MVQARRRVVSHVWDAAEVDPRYFAFHCLPHLRIFIDSWRYCVAAMDGMTASESRRCTLLFEHLGLTDRSKITFLSSLLHKMFEATTILDQHLAEHGASVHSAVSRMLASENLQEPPSHRWIRVVDRLGFFTDAYDHAERIVNIGLSLPVPAPRGGCHCRRQRRYARQLQGDRQEGG